MINNQVDSKTTAFYLNQLVGELPGVRRDDSTSAKNLESNIVTYTIQPMSNHTSQQPEQPQQSQVVIASQRPESGSVTALAVVSIIFGTIGLLGSFIPCLGALAIWVAIPATLCGAGATYMAKSKSCSIGLPVAALVVSALGIIISSVQIIALSGAAKAANEALDEEIKRQQKAQQEQIQNGNETETH